MKNFVRNSSIEMSSVDLFELSNFGVNSQLSFRLPKICPYSESDYVPLISPSDRR